MTNGGGARRFNGCDAVEPVHLITTATCSSRTHRPLQTSLSLCIKLAGFALAAFVNCAGMDAMPCCAASDDAARNKKRTFCGDDDDDDDDGEAPATAADTGPGQRARRARKDQNNKKRKFCGVHVGSSTDVHEHGDDDGAFEVVPPAPVEVVKLRSMEGFVESDDDWLEMAHSEGVVRDGREAVEHLARLPSFRQRGGVSLLVAPDRHRAVAQLRLQLSAGDVYHSRHPETGAPVGGPAVTLQQISVRPSERGRRHPARIMDELAEAAAALEPARRLVIQSVFSDRLRRILLKLGAQPLPHDSGSFVYRRTRRPEPDASSIDPGNKKAFEHRDEDGDLPLHQKVVTEEEPKLQKVLPRCAVCIQKRKGPCGSDKAPKDCERRNPVPDRTTSPQGANNEPTPKLRARGSRAAGLHEVRECCYKFEGCTGALSDCTRCTFKTDGAPPCSKFVCVPCCEKLGFPNSFLRQDDRGKMIGCVCRDHFKDRLKENGLVKLNLDWATTSVEHDAGKSSKQESKDEKVHLWLLELGAILGVPPDLPKRLSDLFIYTPFFLRRAVLTKLNTCVDSFSIGFFNCF